MTGRIVVARIGSVRFAVHLNQVAAVIEAASETMLPLAPPFLNRAIHIKGCLVPVLDMGLFWGLNTAATPGQMIIMAGDNINLALHVDLVQDIIPAESIEGQEPLDDECCPSQLTLPTGSIPLLSTGKLLQVLERELAAGPKPLRGATPDAF